MDKPSKSMNKILKFLPKAAQASVSFQNPPFSPGRSETRLKTHMHKGFSGPIVPMIPREARSGKSKNFETTPPEPTSPKVSCMGQIKHKKINNICKNKKQQTSSLPRGYKDKKPEIKITTKTKPEINPARGLKKKASGRLGKIFSTRRRSDASADRLEPEQGGADRAPTLSQMRRFASSRDTFSNFDWTTAAQVGPGDGDYDDRGYSDGEDDEVIIPFSAPILGAGVGAGGLALEPRKEINLWKRRVMAQPKPLRLDVNGAQ